MLESKRRSRPIVGRNELWHERLRGVIRGSEKEKEAYSCVIGVLVRPFSATPNSCLLAGVEKGFWSMIGRAELLYERSSGIVGSLEKKEAY